MKSASFYQPLFSSICTKCINKPGRPKHEGCGININFFDTVILLAGLLGFNRDPSYDNISFSGHHIWMARRLGDKRDKAFSADLYKMSFYMTSTVDNLIATSSPIQARLVFVLASYSRNGIMNQGGNSIGFFDSPKLGDLSPLSPSSVCPQTKEREGGGHPTLGLVTQLWAVKKSNWIATLASPILNAILVHV